jgi:hypothetical protein
MAVVETTVSVAAVSIPHKYTFPEKPLIAALRELKKSKEIPCRRKDATRNQCT